MSFILLYQQEQAKRLPSIKIGGTSQVQEVNDINQNFNSLGLHTRTLRFYFENSTTLDGECMKNALKDNIKKLTCLEGISIILDSVNLNAGQVSAFMESLEEIYLKIKEFSFQWKNNWNISAPIIDEIFERLKNFQNLEEVSIEIPSNKNLIPKVIGGHLKSLKKLKTLKYLSINTQQPNSEEFFAELSEIQSLEEFTLDYKYTLMTTKESQELGEMISKLPLLKKLHLEISQCHLTNEGIEAIGKGFGAQKSIQNFYLDISHNQFENDSLLEFAKNIRNMTSLQSCEVIMNSHSFDEKSFATLSESFSLMKQLKKFTFHSKLDQRLILTSAKIDFVDFKLFSNILKSFNNLIALDIRLQSGSFVPILNNLKYCEQINDLSFSLDLSIKSDTSLNYSEKDIQKALENIENIGSISLFFVNQYSENNKELTALIISTIRKLHNTSNISLDFIECVHYYNAYDFLESFQNECFDSLLQLKDSLLHLSITTFKYDSIKQKILEFTKLTNLLSLMINVKDRGGYTWTDVKQPKQEQNKLISSLIRLVDQQIDI